MTQLTPQDGFAVVTGAGSGLGRALAVRLCEEGFTVAGVGRRAAPLAETGAACAGAFLPVPLDISNWGAVQSRFADLTKAQGPLALLINNAAVYPHRDTLDETGDSFMQTVAINLGGTVNCTLAALADMGPRGQGRILNVATFADLDPLPVSSAYAVSKGAARIQTRALIADLADRFPGIVLSDWMPGMLSTGMGIPDGLAPEVSARWGVKLALMRDPDLTGSIFEMGQEILPPRSLRRKLKDALLMRRPRPRSLL